MNEAPRVWRLHLGAHKTATTHLQEQLEGLRTQLETAGVGAATPYQLRPARALDLRWRRPEVWLGRTALRKKFTTRIATRTQLHPVMILSEEGVLGNAADPLHRAFYPKATFKVSRLASALLAEKKSGIWLSIRRLDQFLSAAYATALKHTVLPFNAQSFATWILQAPPDWSNLLSRVSRAAPGVSITVWDHADYRANTHAILEDLSGVPIHQLPDIADPVSTKTPDLEAIHKAELLPPDKDTRIRAEHIAKIYDAATGPRFSLFTPAQAETLQELYYQQLVAIQKLPNVRFLSF